MLFSSIQFIANALLIIYHNKSSELQQRCYTRCMNQLLRMCTYYYALFLFRDDQNAKSLLPNLEEKNKTLLIINYLQINCALFLLHNHSSFFRIQFLLFFLSAYTCISSSNSLYGAASQLASSCLYAIKPQLVDESISPPLSQFTAVVLFYFA